MKRILFFLLIAFSTGIGACATSVQTEQPIGTDSPRATETPPPSATAINTVIPTASATPGFLFDISGYDPDIYPPIYVQHQPQLIVRSGETITLKFFIVNNRIYCNEVPCQVAPLLYYVYGGGNTFQTVPLVYENIDGMEYLIARLPATDRMGGSLRYYAEFAFPEAGYTQRHPSDGTIDLFTAANFILLELPAENPVEPGDKVYNFYWGYGPNTVRTELGQGYRIGPSAMDIANDGRIALLNPVNNGVLIYDPNGETYSNFSLPSKYSGEGDLAFDQNGRLMVCDFNGKKFGDTNIGIPYCYCLLPDGSLGASTLVYVQFPAGLTRDLKVLNDYDYQLAAPFDSHGKPNSRETQRQKQILRLPYELVLGADGSFDGYTARFADTEDNVAFEVHSDAGLGVLVGFEKTPQGYLMMFNSGYEQIRAVWTDPDGIVLKDVTLPSGQYSVLSFGSVAVAQDGSLYVMSSTQNGIEVHFEAAP